MKKSITVIGKNVDHVFVIKDIDVDKVTIDKYSVDCRSDLEQAWTEEKTWEENGEQKSLEILEEGGVVKNEDDDSDVFDGRKKIEVVLVEKQNSVTLLARANVVEMLSRMGGKIVQDIVTERPKRGRRVYLSDIKFFNEAK